jgi:hypothetical protein
MNPQLTGNFEHRLEGAFSKELVLYVEYKASYLSETECNDTRNGERYTAFKKASPQDLVELYKMGYLK